jgi:hypothetical protein
MHGKVFSIPSTVPYALALEGRGYFKNDSDGKCFTVRWDTIRSVSSTSVLMNKAQYDVAQQK